MRVLIVCPARAGTRHGNRVTALRWSRILRRLGHRVTIRESFQENPGGDLLVALHARRSAPSVERFRRTYPKRPIVVALTGTDVYRDLHSSRRARTALRLATRLVVLQPLAVGELAPRARAKATVVFQSARSARKRRARRRRTFEVSVIGHLRPEKDPFRAALAARRLADPSAVRVVHVGKAMTAGMERRARREVARNRRYRWLGERPPGRARGILAASRLMVISSRMEGGANVVSEALASGVPILASRIPGNVGLLGRDYPGYFRAGDAGDLAGLLARAERDPRFLSALTRACRRRRWLASPARERRKWERLLRGLARGRS